MGELCSKRKGQAEELKGEEGRGEDGREKNEEKARNAAQVERQKKKVDAHGEHSQLSNGQNLTTDSLGKPRHSVWVLVKGGHSQTMNPTPEKGKQCGLPSLGGEEATWPLALVSEGNHWATQCRLKHHRDGAR